MLLCVHEDRPAAWAGVQLLVLSLARHCPDLTVAVSVPNPDAALRSWVEAQANAFLHVDQALIGQGWNAKPRLLLHFLDAGRPEVTWIDSDIVLAGDFRERLRPLKECDLVSTEAQYWDLFQGGTVRTELWGMKPGRSLPCLVSSGIVRVTGHHRDLLRAWDELLADGEYQRVQKISMYQRPVHMLGDQDVLTALLGAAPFSDIPLVLLRRGRDIVQSVGPAGYTLGERLANIGRGLAPLIHCGGLKPWEFSDESGSRYWRTYLELCPYLWVARQYREQLGRDLPGMDVRTWQGRLCRWLSADHPSIQGIPQALFHTLARRLKHWTGRTAWPDPQAHVDPSRQPHGDQLLAKLGIGTTAGS